MASDFWVGANSTFEQGANIGSDIYLKKLAAKIQARQQDRKNLWEEIKAKKKRDEEVADLANTQAFTATENEKNRKAGLEKDNTTLDTEYLRVLKTPKDQWTETDKNIVEAYDKKNAPKPEKQTFDKEAHIAQILSIPKAKRTPEQQDYLDYYKTGGSSDVPHEAAMAAAKSNVERQVKPKEEAVSNLQKRLDESYTAPDSSAVQPLLDKAIHERDSTYQANPLIGEYNKIRNPQQEQTLASPDATRANDIRSRLRANPQSVSDEEMAWLEAYIKKGKIASGS